MKLSTTSRYAVRAMVDITMHQDMGPVSIQSIANRQDISTKYLEIILLPLKKAGLLKSTRGMKGGYQITKNPNKITAGDVVRIVDGPFDPVDCVSSSHTLVCEKMNRCSTRLLWMKLKTAVDEILDSVTIQELANQQLDLNNALNSV